MFPLLIAGNYRHIMHPSWGRDLFQSTIGEGMTMDSLVWQICRKAGSNYLHVYFDLYNQFQFSFKPIGKMGWTLGDIVVDLGVLHFWMPQVNLSSSSPRTSMLPNVPLTQPNRAGTIRKDCCGGWKKPLITRSWSSPKESGVFWTA